MLCSSIVADVHVEIFVVCIVGKMAQWCESTVILV